MSQYGSFTARSLTSSLTSIQAQYGSVNIQLMQDGQVDVAYGNLVIKSANTIKLTHKMGKLRLGKVSELTTTASYSDLDIVLFQQSRLMNINFSDQFRMTRLGESLSNLDMALSYSSVVLPVNSRSNYNFEASLTHTGFSYPASVPMVLQSQSVLPTEGDTIKHYSGKVGKKSQSRVKVVGNYSVVSFQ